MIGTIDTLILIFIFSTSHAGGLRKQKSLFCEKLMEKKLESLRDIIGICGSHADSVKCQLAMIIDGQGSQCMYSNSCNADLISLQPGNKDRMISTFLQIFKWFDSMRYNITIHEKRIKRYTLAENLNKLKQCFQESIKDLTVLEQCLVAPKFIGKARSVFHTFPFKDSCLNDGRSKKSKASMFDKQKFTVFKEVEYVLLWMSRQLSGW